MILLQISKKEIKKNVDLFPDNPISSYPFHFKEPQGKVHEMPILRL